MMVARDGETNYGKRRNGDGPVLGREQGIAAIPCPLSRAAADHKHGMADG